MRENETGTVESPFGVINIKGEVLGIGDTQQEYRKSDAVGLNYQVTETIDVDIVCNSCEITGIQMFSMLPGIHQTETKPVEVASPSLHDFEEFS